MRVIVYVEGPSDKLAMEAVLDPLVALKRSQGVSVEFFPVTKGDRKAQLLTAYPKKAANIVLNDPHATVVLIPDLYPKNKGFPHGTVVEMTKGVLKRFEQALADKGRSDEGVTSRFRMFCFKHDLEALLLAAEPALRRFLNVRELPVTWVLPVEDQDHDLPPKRVVERLFEQRGRRCVDTTHAPSILRASDCHDLATRCPQCFGPFVKFLEQLAKP